MKIHELEELGYTQIKYNVRSIRSVYCKKADNYKLFYNVYIEIVLNRIIDSYFVPVIKTENNIEKTQITYNNLRDDIHHLLITGKFYESKY